MLQPDYFDGKADKLIAYYQKLEDWILQDIARRLLKAQSMTATADRLVYSLEQMGLHKSEILKKLSSITGKTTAEIKSLLQDAVLTSWNDERAVYLTQGIALSNPLKNKEIMRLMDAEWRKVQGEIDNLTRTTIAESGNQIVSLLNEAEMRVSSGAQSYSQAIIDVLDQCAGQGIMVDYPSGARRNIEAAVRCAVLTSMNQTAAQLSNAYIKEHGIEYVYVSEHLGARHDKKNPTGVSSHDYWQGKVYKIDGSEPGYPNLLESTGYDIDENGNGHVVNPLGLHGYNCRHSHQGWYKDLKVPEKRFTDEESKKRYELSQTQRAMERSIRKTKRRILVKQEEINAVAETDVKDILESDLKAMNKKLARQSEAYNKFCQENGLSAQYDRLHTS